MTSIVKDKSTLSNPDAFETTKFHFDWVVDFSLKTIHGSVQHHIRRLGTHDKSLLLDTRGLQIKKVDVDSTDVEWKLGESAHPFGAQLEVKVPGQIKEFAVTIAYSTTPESSALQWLEPNLTCGKTHPYMFSQCQAIHARSLFPCQDTPMVKAPYTANVSAVQELNVLMSAKKVGDPHASSLGGGWRTHTFDQPIPVPSYLVAIAVGNIVGRRIGPRSTVWCEPEMIDSAAHEFTETEAMLSAAEELCGPYVWGVYDLLVLPPSFPYGGMENPCLTFITPTVLAGDRSMVNVVAHEISHSWTGNLVTNATWDDFWLNEGHTRYLERLVLGRLHGHAHRQLHLKIGYCELQDAVQQFGVGHEFTKLVPDLTGVDPDDAFSRIPYEKGSLLLYYIETLIGKDAMLQWLRAYVEKFKFKSLTTPEWKSFLLHYLTSHNLITDDQAAAINWDMWLYKPDKPYKPDGEFSFDADRTKACDTLAEQWKVTSSPTQDYIDALKSTFDQLTSNQREYFFYLLNVVNPVSLPQSTMTLMQSLYGLDQSTNAEIRMSWSLLTLRSQFLPSLDTVFEFLNGQGRLKYTRPIYRALYQWEAVRARAVDNFHKQRANMHNTTVKMVSKDLHLC